MTAAGITAPAETGTLTLAALPANPSVRFFDRSNRVAIGSLIDDPAAIRMSRSFDGPWMPGLWFVEDYRDDQRGRQWYRCYAATVDDFGTLVEVAS
ncbi:hypothetical protein [uncultured Pseudacidovorax sp.]|uniref:hypothetical protein n=1 Tax=uncultured Pseudacidovorax sp. TaxID=679313 RepID=UPI0025E54BDD|nr:hypothetical protein [uncultured Pseudacidovorax sp.]